MKAQSNGIVALSTTSSANEPLSADLVIRQAVHGVFPPGETYIRPKEGDDICMLDLSGPVKDHLKFLPGLDASRYAPKNPKDGHASKIAIDPDTGAVVLVKNGDTPRGMRRFADFEGVQHETIEHGIDFDEEGETYSDIMDTEHSTMHLSDDEMDLD
jgi:hypothetical protein